MKYNIVDNSLQSLNTDCLCIPLYENHTLCEQGQALDKLLDGQVSNYISQFNIDCDAGKSFFLPVSSDYCKSVIVLGFGSKNTVSQDTLYKALKALANQAKAAKVKELCCSLESVVSETDLNSTQLV